VASVVQVVNAEVDEDDLEAENPDALQGLLGGDS
jgi:hypothetical protein